MRFRALFLLIVLGSASDSFGQAIDTKTFGTLSETVYTLGSWDFEAYDSNTTFAASGYDYRWLTSGTANAQLHLPNGALITSMELEGCDSDPTGEVTVALLNCNGIGCNAQIFNTGVLAIPGCDRFPFTISPALQINNNTLRYMVAIQTGGYSSTSFSGVRVHYKLQVSSAPATATFSDVPTSHPFFQFIEALAASGITAGCTAPPNPNYCPDAPLTRGQMAVFLSRALGLHFPN